MDGSACRAFKHTYTRTRTPHTQVGRVWVLGGRSSANEGTAALSAAPQTLPPASCPRAEQAGRGQGRGACPLPLPQPQPQPQPLPQPLPQPRAQRAEDPHWSHPHPEAGARQQGHPSRSPPQPPGLVGDPPPPCPARDLGLSQDHQVQHLRYHRHYRRHHWGGDPGGPPPRAPRGLGQGGTCGSLGPRGKGRATARHPASGLRPSWRPPRPPWGHRGRPRASQRQWEARAKGRAHSRLSQGPLAEQGARPRRGEGLGVRWRQPHPGPRAPWGPWRGRRALCPRGRRRHHPQCHPHHHHAWRHLPLQRTHRCRQRCDWYPQHRLMRGRGQGLQSHPRGHWRDHPHLHLHLHLAAASPTGFPHHHRQHHRQHHHHHPHYYYRQHPHHLPMWAPLQAVHPHPWPRWRQCGGQLARPHPWPLPPTAP